MINLVQAKSIAEEEEFGYLDSKYELISNSNDGKGDTFSQILDSQQIQELKALFMKITGKDDDT